MSTGPFLEFKTDPTLSPQYIGNGALVNMAHVKCIQNDGGYCRIEFADGEVFPTIEPYGVVQGINQEIMDRYTDGHRRVRLDESGINLTDSKNLSWDQIRNWATRENSAQEQELLEKLRWEERRARQARNGESLL